MGAEQLSLNLQVDRARYFLEQTTVGVLHLQLQSSKFPDLSNNNQSLHFLCRGISSTTHIPSLSLNLQSEAIRQECHSFQTEFISNEQIQE